MPLQNHRRRVTPTRFAPREGRGRRAQLRCLRATRSTLFARNLDALTRDNHPDDGGIYPCLGACLACALHLARRDSGEEPARRLRIEE